MGHHCARRSLRRPWKLGLRIVAWSKPCMFCEESFVGKIKFYYLKALITLEQVNTTEWSKKKQKTILISKTAMVGCCKLSLYANDLVMSMRLIFGNNWNDVPCKSFFLISGNNIISLEFPLNAYTRTKSTQKQVKSIDVNKVGSEKSLASKSCFL